MRPGAKAARSSAYAALIANRASNADRNTFMGCGEAIVHQPAEIDDRPTRVAGFFCAGRERVAATRPYASLFRVHSNNEDVSAGLVNWHCDPADLRVPVC